jgi:DNA-binding SARP family transcriptional activator
MSPLKKDRAGLHVKLLGGFETRLATGQPVTLPTRKAQALLAYLATRPGQAHARDKLAALLWADRGDAQARDSLRHTLVQLRKALPAPASLIAERRAVVLDTARIEVDVARFEARAAAGSAEDLAEAAEIYQGDFLEGFVLREPLFEEWLMAERERLRELAVGTLGRRLEQQCAARNAEPAIQTALRLLALDAAQERAHRALMQLYVQQGRRGAALRQYQTCVGMLRRELGTEPDAETRKLYQEIVRRRDDVQRGGARGGVRPGATRSLVAPMQPVAVRPAPGFVETPLIGRDTELATLCTAFDEARRGRGRMVAIVGEAGIGKTRLVAELARTAAEHDTRVLTARCYESEQILPFGPWVDALRAGQVVPDDPALLALEPAWRAELARLFPEIAAADLPAPTDDARRLFESITLVIRSLATAQPVLVVLEDVHWADEMTVRLAAFLGRRIAVDRVLVAMTAREEDLVEADALRRVLAELRGAGHVAELALSPLSCPDTARLVRCLTAAGSDSQGVARVEEHAWAASAGNPFVVVETVRALREGITLQTGPSLSLPQRVRDIIAGRVERVSDRGRQLLSVAAVIGRAFDFALLQGASGLTDHAAAEGVEELVRRRVLHTVSDGFDFTHDRIRETVYGGLLPPRRKLLHRDVATTLDALTAGALDRPTAALGMHYRQAEAWDKAVFHLQQAGSKAAARSALRDARGWFEQALDVLAALPESPSTLEQAFEIRLELRLVLSMLGEVRLGMERLREAEAIAERLNDDGRRGLVCAVLINPNSHLGELDEALVTGTRALEIAGRLGDLRLRLLTTTYLEQAHYYRGEYDRVVALATDNLAALPADWVYEDFGAAAPASVYDRHWLVIALAQLGRFAEAALYAAEAIRLAEPTQHANTGASLSRRFFQIGQGVALAHFAAGMLHLLKGNWPAARSLIEHWISALRTVEVVVLLPYAVSASSLVLAQLGKASEALSRLREGEQLLEDSAARGIVAHRSWAYHSLGRAGLLLGLFDEARRLADRAVESSPSHHGFAAYARHLLGDIATHPDRFDAERGEVHYREALGLAEPRGMRPLVAHCHRGLGKLYRRTGKREQAHEHLTTATTMYREMDMRFWLEQAETELRRP